MRQATMRGLTLGTTVAVVLAQGICAASDTGAKLFRPSDHDEVDKVSEVTGKVLTRGRPVLLVRAEQAESRWWTQDRVGITSSGQFTANARFGNHRTKVGTRFRVVVLVLPEAEARGNFSPGTSFLDLPSDVPRSAEVTVVLAADNTEIVPDVISSPSADSVVERLAYVRGKARQGTPPRVIVRAESSLWWVQQESETRKDGSFIAPTRFGNGETPEGTQFRVVVIMPNEEQAKAFSRGMTMPNLPRGIPRSKERTVYRKGPNTDPK